MPPMDAEKIVAAMVEFDASLPDYIKEMIKNNEPDYANYKAVIQKLDDLYMTLIGNRDEDPKEVKLEALHALEYFEYRYDVDMKYFQKLLL